MRCTNCLWFPMEEDKELPGLVCPNCGYEHLESCPESFVRSIYQEFMMEDNPLMETLEYWWKNREYELSGERESNLQ